MPHQIQSFIVTTYAGTWRTYRPILFEGEDYDKRKEPNAENVKGKGSKRKDEGKN
jgi:hypothetical protein